MSIEKTDFAKRMKQYETDSEVYLDKTKHTVVRIDGHGFSKWTRGFEKPFDEFIVTVMSETAKALMNEFKAVSAYSQSDEITLIFVPDENMIYSGRVQKITSLMASFASMYFNKLLFKEMIARIDDVEFSLLLANKAGKAFFDARVFQVDTEVEAFNAFLWRAKDCERNSKNVFAQSILSHKECMHKTSDELVNICAGRGYYWEALENKYKYGILWKKENYKKETNEGFCIRTRFVETSKHWSFSEDNVNTILIKKIGEKDNVSI
jgi:tRNA(His) guanylyltransferase